MDSGLVALNRIAAIGKNICRGTSWGKEILNIGEVWGKRKICRGKEFGVRNIHY